MVAHKSRRVSKNTRSQTKPFFLIALSATLLINCQQNALADNSVLHALIWMRTSGEYKALCLQTFNIALQHVRVGVRQRHVQTNPKPPAVIMDLDETVLDNTAYNVYLFRAGLKHSPLRWQGWNRENVDKIGLVPGAKAFIKAVENEGARVVFISNRSSTIREITTTILLKFDLARKEELLNDDPPKLLLRKLTSSKESRRAAVREHYNIIAIIGDNLGDFSDDFRSPAINSIEERREQVRAYADEWGTKWFVMPNPLYGYWTRLIDWDHPERHFRSVSH